ncbi:hypothetical protein SAMN05444172_5428 [Burkholderia sp. GAS332]|nr:hypothetical protein SAMN05444172_5428 [Burkholderia sp. GAS332]
MTDNTGSLAQVIEEAVLGFLSNHGNPKTSIRVLVSDGRTLLTDHKVPAIPSEELLFVQIPNDWIKTMHLYPKSPSGSTGVTSFACPHCGGAIKYSK